MDTIRIELDNGFTADLSPDNLDDYELFEELVEVEENPALTPRVIRKILGEDGYSALKDACRGEDGRVRTTDMFTAIKEIFRQVQSSKKN